MSELSLYEEFEMMKEVAKAAMKGKSPRDIGDELELSTRAVNNYLREYKKWVINEAEQDADLANQFMVNIKESYEHYKLLDEEVWNTIEFCERHEIVGQKIQALKLASSIQSQRDKLIQMTGAKEDAGLREQFRRAQEVNQILSDVLQEVSAHCESCKIEVRLRLTEAFAKMGAPVRENTDMAEIEAEVVEDDE